MSSAAETARLDALKQRKRLMDDMWLLTLLVVMAAVAIPWFQRVLDVDLAPISWSAFAYSCLYLVGSLVADRTTSPRSFLAASIALHAAGVALLAGLWRLSGGLQNPVFLLVFALPVFTGSLMLPRWQAFATAALALAAVTGIAAIESPSLRWYATQIGVPAGGVLDLMGRMGASSVRPFPAGTESPSYLAVLVWLFGILLFGVAAAGGVVGAAFARLQERIASLTEALTRTESLSLETIRSSPWPTVLLDSDTLRIVHASQTFLHQFFVDPDIVGRHNLFDVVRFSFPDLVEEVLATQKGVLSAVVAHVHGERRLLEVHVGRLDQEGRQYLLLSMRDVTDARYLGLAIDTLDDPLVVLDANHRVRAFNSAASRVLGGLEPGVEAGTALRAADAPFDWWHLGRRSRQRRQIQLADRTFTATCVAAPIDGEQEPLTVIRLRAKEADS